MSIATFKPKNLRTRNSTFDGPQRANLALPEDSTKGIAYHLVPFLGNQRSTANGSKTV